VKDVLTQDHSKVLLVQTRPESTEFEDFLLDYNVYNACNEDEQTTFLAKLVERVCSDTAGQTRSETVTSGVGASANVSGLRPWPDGGETNRQAPASGAENNLFDRPFPKCFEALQLVLRAGSSSRSMVNSTMVTVHHCKWTPVSRFFMFSLK
jgi:hypothetical protein